MNAPCFVSSWNGLPLKLSSSTLKCSYGSATRFHTTPARIFMNTSEDDIANPPTPSPAPTAEAEPEGRRNKIEPDENPTYFFGEESLVEPIFKDEVPGKIQLSPEELAEQKRSLEEYAELLRKDRLMTEREEARLFGWVKYAETMNGRFAMFFFLTGLLTEYWTDYTIPEQVELLLRTLGVI